MMNKFPENFTNTDKYILTMALAMSTIPGIMVYGRDDFRDDEDIYETIEDFGGYIPSLSCSELKAIRSKPALMQAVQYGRVRQAERLTANGWQMAYRLAVNWCVWAGCDEPLDYCGEEFWNELFNHC